MLGEDNPMLGQEVGGTMLLEIPPQKGPLNLDALKHADAEDIVIADPTGRIYTREHPEGRHFTKAEMIETFGKELSPP